ncbi:hypothetical protein BH24ACT3_BH24ACT3_14410 [soil metagenome]
MTVRLTLVRHAHAAAGYGDHPDPGLDDVGRAQAERVAAALAHSGPLPLVVSPLRRTLETAASLAARWASDLTIDRTVGEIRPPIEDLAGRRAWLADAMAGSWSDLDDASRRWRDEVLASVRAQPGDAVVVTHFIAINAIVGSATHDDRVVCFAPGNGSCTIVEVDGTGRLQVIELGAEAVTEVRPG